MTKGQKVVGALIFAGLFAAASASSANCWGSRSIACAGCNYGLCYTNCNGLYCNNTSYRPTCNYNTCGWRY